MSLKVKIPLLVTAMLLINVVILLLFNRLYFIYVIAERMEKWSGKPIDVDALQGSQAIGELILFEMLVIGVLIIVVGIAVYFLYVKPLVTLNQKVITGGHSKMETTARRDEIGMLQNTISRLMRSLAEEKLVQDRMIASISHDIKTPLTSVLGYSENLLKKQLPPARQAQYLKTINASARDIEHITDEFDSYILGKQQGAVLKKPVRATYLADMLTEEYGNAEFGFAVQNLCSESFEAELDLPKMRRVFANLIQNAIKHNRGKADLKVTVTLSEAADGISIRVSDNGRGVSPELLPFIFEPFYTTENRAGISGLGLSICRDIVEKHGGRISAGNSTEGFSILIEIR